MSTSRRRQDEPAVSSDAWLQLARGAADRGEILLAVDLADRGLAHDRENLALQHVAVLALARAGATEIAARRFAAGPLATSQEPDALALGARIAKDLALRATGVERVEGARLAAGAYGAIGGSYPLVNAAAKLPRIAIDDRGQIFFTGQNNLISGRLCVRRGGWALRRRRSVRC